MIGMGFRPQAVPTARATERQNLMNGDDAEPVDWKPILTLAPDTKIMMSGDMKKVIAESKRIEKEHMAATKEVRRELGIKLAKEIVAKL